MSYTNDFFFAQIYSGGNYSSSTYQNGTTATSGVTTGSSTSSGILANTGIDLLVIVTLACVLIFVALLVRFWKRPNKGLSTGL